MTDYFSTPGGCNANGNGGAGGGGGWIMTPGAQRYSKSRFAPEGALRGNLSESIDSWSAGT